MRRICILLITIALIAGMVGCGGTPSSVEIRDWYDLDAVRNNLGGNHKLMNDLDSTTAGYEELASPTANQGKGWQPIGNTDNKFTGSFAGQGYEIRDFYINRPGEDFVGLFGFVDDEGVIQDIGVVNADVTANRYVGGLVAWNQGIVSSIYASSNVTGSLTVGGLVGSNYGGTVSKSYAIGGVAGDNFIGGLVGANAGAVSNSYSTGSVTGNYSGGLAGFNQGAVSNCYATGNVAGYGVIGGLVGWDYHGTVSYSYSTGNVTGNSTVGGLMGLNELESVVSNSYTTGSVTGDEFVGGLVGGNAGNVSNSYSAGNVTGVTYVGGLIGENEGEGTISNSYWNIETSGQNTSAGGTGLNTTEMRDIVTFSGAGWNITAVANAGTRNPSYIWNIVDDVTYPFLSWESVS